MREQYAVSPDEDDELTAPLKRMLAERLDGDAAVTGIARKRAAYSSSYATEIVTVYFEDREPLRIFLKDYAVAAWQKDLMPERRLREVAVYRELIGPARLGTPEYYGAVWDEGRRRYWLLIEHVDGPQVKWCEFDDWLRSAAWLGRLHGRFPPGTAELAKASYLVQHNEEFFRDNIKQALVAVRATAPALYDRLLAAVADYRRTIRELAALPPTLVHGGYRPQNVIRAGSPEAPRICPADWEEAALGSAFYDFAYISDGFYGERLAALWRAYRDEAERHGVELPADREAMRLVSAFNVHKNLGTVSKAADRGFSVDDVEKLVTMVEASAAASDG